MIAQLSRCTSSKVTARLFLLLLEFCTCCSAVITAARYAGAGAGAARTSSKVTVRLFLLLVLSSLLLGMTQQESALTLMAQQETP